jgi:site-specific DNA-methyltransferase (adenine-specific)
MTAYYQDRQISIYCGDCREIVSGLDLVDAVVTDPPYGLKFMGKGWDRGVPGIEFWERIGDVMEPGAHLLAFGGTRTFHRLTCAIEDAGLEIRDCIMWVYGSGFPKGKALDGGWGTTLKPAWEPIILARKPLVGSAARNVEKHGTGAINIDGCQVASPEGRPRRMLADNQTADNCYGDRVRDSRAEGTTTLGRWPANLIHDGSAEVEELFPREAGAFAPVKGTEPSLAESGQVYSLRKRVGAKFHGDSGPASRFFYCAKASKAERNI